MADNAAPPLVNLVRVIINVGGSSALGLGIAYPGFRGVEALQNLADYSYTIQQDSDFEYGTGTYLSSGSLFVRSPLGSSNGGAPINVIAGTPLNFVTLAQDVPGPTGPPGPPGNSDGSTIITFLSANTTLDDTYFGGTVPVNASAGNVTITYPIALGTGGLGHIVTIERDLADTSTNAIIIQDDSPAERGRIVSPVAGGMVPFLQVYSDGTNVKCRGNP